jgi:hypothetical protein
MRPFRKVWAFKVHIVILCLRGWICLILIGTVAKPIKKKSIPVLCFAFFALTGPHSIDCHYATLPLCNTSPMQHCHYNNTATIPTLLPCNTATMSTLPLYNTAPLCQHWRPGCSRSPAAPRTPRGSPRPRICCGPRSSRSSSGWRSSPSAAPRARRTRRPRARSIGRRLGVRGAAE